MRLEEVIRQSPVVIHAGEFSVLQIRSVPSGPPHFALFRDDAEMTVVTTVDRARELDVIKSESPFVLIEFQVTVPFEAPGFLARICGALGEGGINVLVYSTFSRDYVLVRTGDLDSSLQRLRGLGFMVTDRRSSAPRPR